MFVVLWRCPSMIGFPSDDMEEWCIIMVLIILSPLSNLTTPLYMEQLKGLNFPGSQNTQFCRLVVNRSRHLLKPVRICLIADNYKVHLHSSLHPNLELHHSRWLNYSHGFLLNVIFHKSIVFYKILYLNLYIRFQLLWNLWRIPFFCNVN